MEKGICEKCKKYTWTEKHHVLPNTLFSENETYRLCPNCHTDYHEKSGYKYLRNNHKQEPEWYYYKFFKWLYLACIIIISIVILSWV